MTGLSLLLSTMAPLEKTQKDHRSNVKLSTQSTLNLFANLSRKNLKKVFRFLIPLGIHRLLFLREVIKAPET